MLRPRNGKLAARSDAELADAKDLRAVISAALVATPVDERSLWRGVWTFVGEERNAGTSPGHVIIALTALVDAANISPAPSRQALMRRVILWSVEAYFGHLGGDVVGHDGAAFADAPTLAAMHP